MADENTEREIAGILKPHFEVSGTQATRRPVMQPVETPDVPETPPPPLRTVSERLAELHAKVDLINTKIDLLLAILK